MSSTRKTCVFFTALLAAIPTLGAAQEATDSHLEEALRRSPNNPSGRRPPADRGERPERHERRTARFPDELRTLDGTGNNGSAPERGSAGVELLRRIAADYGDGSGSPAGQSRAGAREISNLCVAQAHAAANHAGASDFLWQWGQFLDHDIDLTPEVDPAEPFDVTVPAGDLWFDPSGSGEVTIPFHRSLYSEIDGVRQQVNAITAYVDASNVYGSDAERARALRTLDGTGRLATSDGDLLPFNTAGLPNAAPGGSDPAAFFLAGDFRANEQVGLTAMHTLFVREHNHWAARIREVAPELDGDGVYQHARAIVGAEMQAITYREFLPLLLGRDALRRYRGYRPEVDAGIANVFSTAAYRFGHSMLSPRLLRFDAEGQEIAAGHLSLADAFFDPQETVLHGIEPVLRGLASQRAQEIDNYLIDEVRNFLFGPPGSGGFDLASLNIQRGRDHGLPGYNQVREAYGLEPATDFADVNEDPTVQANLAAAYDSVDDLDLWVGGLAEAHSRGALVGETFFTILKDQFERLRAGDRFWYQGYLPRGLVRLVEEQTLARIIRRNTLIGRELPRNPFLIRPPGDQPPPRP